jgi:molybdopterin molybdotransferase
MKTFIGFDQALALTLSAVRPGRVEKVPLATATGKYLAADVFSKVDSPSSTTSRKDGYAVISADISAAGRDCPVYLELVGASYAGKPTEDNQIQPGQAFQVTTGATLPDSADAVISEEHCRRDGRQIACFHTAEPGRNILERGNDVGRNDLVMTTGRKIGPPAIGLLAAAGCADVPVNSSPRVLVIASGDEVVSPGVPLKAGQLYASNMMEMRSWLNVFGMDCTVEIVADRKSEIEAVIARHIDRTDVFLTSGGAWGSEKDLMLKTVAALGWRGIYHRVRMSPGKPAGFGLLDQRPFFILPGGPPANEMAFLQLALPAIIKMIGGRPEIFPVISATLTQTVTGGKDWTNFIHANLKCKGPEWEVAPIRLNSRLKSMALKNAIAILPEGVTDLKSGKKIKTQVLPGEPEHQNDP